MCRQLILNRKKAQFSKSGVKLRITVTGYGSAKGSVLSMKPQEAYSNFVKFCVGNENILV